MSISAPPPSVHLPSPAASRPLRLSISTPPSDSCSTSQAAPAEWKARVIGFLERVLDVQ